MEFFFKTAWNDIRNRKNLELYLILAITIIVLGADIFGVETESALFEIILAALAILIYGLIDSRQTAERIEKQLDETRQSQSNLIKSMDEIPQLIARATKVGKLFKSSDISPITELAKDATAIDIMTWAASGLFDRYDGFFYKKMEEGCKFRLIIIDPKSEAANVIYENSRHKEIKSDIIKMINKCKRLPARFENRKIYFELRLTKWLMPTNMIIIDGNKPNGVISLGLYPAYLRTPQDQRRYMLVDSRNTKEEYFHFCDQFEKLWNDKENTSRVDLESIELVDTL
ncbi:MAG: hypothetical protein MN733_06840 [Nitrososphaera sp.]|nr:hypothetical protein [Nitrososphaera sp.]